MYLEKLFNLKGKVVAVIGAGGHLCSEMAKSFARVGCKIVLLDLRIEKANHGGKSTQLRDLESSNSRKRLEKFIATESRKLGEQGGDNISIDSEMERQSDFVCYFLLFDFCRRLKQSIYQSFSCNDKTLNNTMQLYALSSQ